MRALGPSILSGDSWLCLPHAAEWKQGAGFRSSALSIPGEGKTGFTLLNENPSPALASPIISPIAASRKIRSVSSVPAWRWAMSMATVSATFIFAGWKAANALYRNLGNWKFEDITAQSGVAAPTNIPPAPRSLISMAMAIWICS